MKNFSIWKDGSFSINSCNLDSDIECDVLIIGGGLTGISTLYHLKDSKFNCVLVEQNKIGMGVSANSTGKLTYLQDSMYNKIWKKYDKITASKYLESQRDAINLVKNIIKDNDLECDLTKSKSYVYTDSDKEIDSLVELKDFLIDNNIDVKDDALDLVENKYVITVDDTYLFNPVKFIYELVFKCNLDNYIYEGVSIVKIDRDEEYYLS